MEFVIRKLDLNSHACAQPPTLCNLPGSSDNRIFFFSMQECWRRLLPPSPGDLPDSGIEPVSPSSPLTNCDNRLGIEPLSLGSLMYTVRCVCVCCYFTCARLFETLWTEACQVPLSMGYSRQKYWVAMSSSRHTVETIIPTL